MEKITYRDLLKIDKEIEKKTNHCLGFSWSNGLFGGGFDLKETEANDPIIKLLLSKLNKSFCKKEDLSGSNV